MRPVIVKVYGSLHPAGEASLTAVRAILADWHIKEAVELKDGLLCVSHEGEHFPADDVIAALRPFVTERSEGKLDVIDLENWQLRRFLFQDGQIRERLASLDQALESCKR
jgi:hypothetical protein